MVTITVLMEGGAAPGSPADVQTVNNTQALRESLHRLFRENLSMEVSVVVDMLHGYKNVVKHFFRQSSGSSVFLYVDLDGASHTKGSWFEKLEADGLKLSEEQKRRFFFMIQEMEAWMFANPGYWMSGEG